MCLLLSTAPGYSQTSEHHVFSRRKTYLLISTRASAENSVNLLDSVGSFRELRDFSIVRQEVRAWIARGLSGVLDSGSIPQCLIHLRNFLMDPL
ncbi:hypothetical protein JTB14_017225 [Gonioctena quinquepunctata]|nr:hypothetical protein JTB14_017225 [Gonioctena quinquepunctata]